MKFEISHLYIHETHAQSMDLGDLHSGVRELEDALTKQPKLAGDILETY